MVGDVVAEQGSSNSAYLAMRLRPLFILSVDIDLLATGFHQFCSRPYRKRLRVLQEFSLAKDILILCGSARITYIQLHRAVPCRFKGEVPKSNAILKAVAEIMQCSSQSFVQRVLGRRYYAASPEPLFNVLFTSLPLEEDYNHPECSNPLDRIFSVLRLTSDASAFKSFPDYSKSCEDIYEEVSRQMLLQGYLEVLSYCQFPRQDRGRKMASWAPDYYIYLQRPCSNYNTHFTASKEISSENGVAFPDPATLEIFGTFVDIIEEFGSAWDPDWLAPLPPTSTLKYISEIRGFCKKIIAYFGGRGGVIYSENCTRRRICSISR